MRYILFALALLVAACGMDDDDTTTTTDTGADVPFMPFDGQWEGTLTSPDADPIEVWIHFDLESGGVIGLPCAYESVNAVARDDNAFSAVFFDRNGDRVAETFSTQAVRDPDRVRVSFNTTRECTPNPINWSGHLYP